MQGHARVCKEKSEEEGKTNACKSFLVKKWTLKEASRNRSRRNSQYSDSSHDKGIHSVVGHEIAKFWP